MLDSAWTEVGRGVQDDGDVEDEDGAVVLMIDSINNTWFLPRARHSSGALHVLTHLNLTTACEVGALIISI